MSASVLVTGLSVVLVFLTSPDLARAEAGCGHSYTGPCVVTVDSPSRSLDDLQEAIDAADDGATITVEGVCSGPVRIYRRRDLTIKGVSSKMTALI